MAGLGYYEFQGEAVLTASQVNGYLMQQSVMVQTTEAALNNDLGVVKSAGMMGYFIGGSDLVSRPHFYDGSVWNRIATQAEVEAQENRTGQVLLYMEVIN